MKHFKTLLCFLLVTAITLSLCSCGLVATRLAHEEVVDKLKQNVTSLQNIPSVPTQHEVALKRGNEIGNVCYTARLNLITADGIQEQTIDPTSFGKVTVMNFWGTWCGASVVEMPYFDAIAKKYGDQIAVVAVHGALSKNAPAFIAQNYADSPIVFAADTGDNENEYYSQMGGGAAYPATFVLNEKGIITHVFTQSVTEAQLETAVLEAMGRM